MPDAFDGNTVEHRCSIAMSQLLTVVTLEVRNVWFSCGTPTLHGWWWSALFQPCNLCKASYAPCKPCTHVLHV